jgi:hypothetical protein|tara:strand:- start:87 stop:299 length:213 start_codon:yes stop_codon:yes gene_type:complete
MASPYTQTQLDALDTALAEGVLTIEYDGRRVTYRSLAEMQSIRGRIYRSLQVDAGTRTTRQIDVYASKDN